MSQKFPDNVIPIARTANQHKLAEYYSMADCFVICSDKETFSMTCAESLCCGTKVAGFKAGGPESIFKENAEFCEHGEVEELCKLLKSLSLIYCKKNVAEYAMPREIY
jgi:glycosyltransferase involved in cell wall biosynthesis